MSKDINNLIVSVGDTLKEFAGGNISHTEAITEYKKLLKRYNKIASRLKRNINVNQIEGLCYYNNINNFSLFSGIYTIEKDDLYYVAYYGDSSLNARAMKIILENTGNIVENNVVQIPAGNDENFRHNIFLYIISSDKKTKTVFAAVTSSTFFSEDKFIFLAKLIKNIFSILFDGSLQYKNNYFEGVSKEVAAYLDSNIDDAHSVQVTLFVFNMLEKIFNHKGIHALIEVSNNIYETIKDNYRHNSKCFPLSIRDYIALEKINKNDTLKANKQKPEFVHQNINIPYHSLKLKIDKKESIQVFWDQVLTFENYLSMGDIVK